MIGVYTRGWSAMIAISPTRSVIER